MKITRLYCVTCLSNDKMYVGITSQLLRDRWKSHRWDARKGSDLKFHRAIRKHSPEQFEIVLLREFPSREEALEAEILTIQALDLRTKGYNSTIGGDGGVTRSGFKHSEETRRRISNALKGQKRAPLSEEHRAKIALAGIGRVPTEETRRKLSIANKDKRPPLMTEATRLKLAATWTGRKHTPESLEKMAAARYRYWENRRQHKEKDLHIV